MSLTLIQLEKRISIPLKLLFPRKYIFPCQIILMKPRRVHLQLLNRFLAIKWLECFSGSKFPHHHSVVMDIPDFHRQWRDAAVY
jgi:hypothetical protein